MSGRHTESRALRTESRGVSLKNKKVHFIGVGGCGMSGLALLAGRRGAVVSGSDLADSAQIAKLLAEGVHVEIGQRAENIPPDTDWVIRSAAIEDENPELQSARIRELPILRYSQLLGHVMESLQGVAVAGTHGKSTTSALTAWCLAHAGRNPGFVVGGNVPQLGGGAGAGGGPDFIAEACEYRRSFLDLTPKIAVILNMEEDHLDYYADLEEIISAFGDFAALVPKEGLLVVNGDCPAALAAAKAARCWVIRFGFGPDNDWRADEINENGKTQSFRLLGPTESPYHNRRFHLSLAGKHHVMNALSVLAVADRLGVDPVAVGEALTDFQGVGRRLTLRADIKGIRVLDDYGHHPTEIRCTLKAARSRFHPKRLWCIFQPHQHSRTRFLLDAFAESFDDADVVLLPDIYFVRDSEADRQLVSAADLAAKIRARGARADYMPETGQIVDYLKINMKPGDLVITMGAGNVWKIADELVRWIKSDG